MNDKEIEQEIQRKGLNHGPRITPADVEANITGEYYFTAGDGLYAAGGTNQPVPDALNRVTFCVLILRNGFTLVGVNEGGISPLNFDAELGKKLARQKAVDQMWPLMGYALKEKLAGR